jgi:hypothetical protein
MKAVSEQSSLTVFELKGGKDNGTKDGNDYEYGKWDGKCKGSNIWDQ